MIRWTRMHNGRKHGNKQAVLLLLAVCTVVYACSNLDGDNDSPVNFNLSQASNVGSLRATLSGEVSITGNTINNVNIYLRYHTDFSDVENLVAKGYIIELDPFVDAAQHFEYTLKMLRPNSTYHYVVEAIMEGHSYPSSVYSFKTTEIPKGAVDLGLSVLWATCNVGASLPGNDGDYFAWGETEPKSDYSWNTYKWANGSETSLTKYNTDKDYGKTDGVTRLEMTDDAANVVLGSPWRMPTFDEFKELFDNSVTKFSESNGYWSWEVKSKKNGACVYFPLPGWCNGTNHTAKSAAGHYWSSSLYSDATRSA